MAKILVNPTADTEREFRYGPADFAAVRSMLLEITGIKLSDSKDAMVYSRLVRRIRELKLKGFSDYMLYLQKHPEEEQQFINALTTNLTSFFREPHHFDILQKYLFTIQRPITIWCAASSTGEEPYSIAMIVAETFGGFATDVRIIASDIDSQVLQKAKAGIYPNDRVKGLDQNRLKQFFYRGKGSKQGFVKVVPELQQMVQFKQLNLLSPKWSLPDSIDIIFCRNVMIYFDKSTQQQVLKRMVDLLPEDGLYIAGHSENFSHLPDLVRAIGKTTYLPVKQRSLS